MSKNNHENICLGFKKHYFQRLYKWFYLLVRIGLTKILSEIISHLFAQVNI